MDHSSHSHGLHNTMDSMNKSAQHMNHLHMNHSSHMGTTSMQNYSDHSGHTMHMNHSNHMDHMTMTNHSNHMDHMGMTNHSNHMDHMAMHNHSNHMDHMGMDHMGMHNHSDTHFPGNNVLQADHSQHVGSHRMFFTTDAEDVSLLFEPWKLDTKSGIFFAIIVIIILAVVFEGVKSLRQYIHRDFRLNKRSIKSREHLLQTILYLVQIMSSYVLMLAIMTYNVWIVVATISGLGLGYFLCAYAFSKRTQARRNCGEGTCSPACSDARGTKTGAEKIEHELEPLHGADNMCEECRETDI